MTLVAFLACIARTPRALMRLRVMFIACAFLVVTGCDSSTATCREKLGTYSCERANDVLSCDDIDDNNEDADPVCVCDGEFSVASDGSCRRRDPAACCACLATGTDAGPCLTANDDAATCRAKLETDAGVAVWDACSTTECRGPCWFLVEVTTSPL